MTETLLRGTSTARRLVMRFLGGVCFASLAVGVLLEGGAETLARDDTPQALERALKIPFAPPNARHAEHLAEIAPESARKALVRALTLNPRMTSARIALGLLQERTGDMPSAETTLLEAARFNRQYLPAWTLANFYFRLGQQDEFWRWAARASHATYDDFRPLLRLASELEPEPAISLDLLGSTPALERAYLDFLIGSARLPATRVIAERLLERHDPQDQPRLANLVSRLIRSPQKPASEINDALAIWNAIFIPLDAQHGPVLTNGDLAQKPTGVGFDWNILTSRGIEAKWSAGVLKFDLADARPETVAFLEQAIPVAEGKRYLLQFESRLVDAASDGPSETNGPLWEWRGRPAAELSMRPGWQTGECTLLAPQAGVEFLRLVYQRRPGTVPMRGTVSLRNIRMQVL